MNLEQIINEVNKDLDDTLDNADIIGWVNRSIDDLTTHANYQKSAVISVIVGQKEYELPDDLVSIYQVFDTDKALERVYDTQSKGYRIWGNKLILQPAPDQNKEIDLYYFANLPHLKDPEDVPAFSSQFHDLLVLYAVGRAKYQDEEEGMQMNAISDYQERKRAFVNHYRLKEITAIQDVYGI